MKIQSLIYAMLLTFLFAALAVGQGTAKNKGAQAGGVEQQLKQMEDDWQKATRTKDAAALRGIIAEDWVATDDKESSSIGNNIFPKRHLTLMSSSLTKIPTCRCASTATPLS